MTHDKVRAAARQRMTQTGEPYTAARRAVITGRQQASGQVPPPGAGYALRMSGEVHDWLTDLRDSDPAAARTITQALVALQSEGARLGEPLVASTAGSWAQALAEGLDRSYREMTERLTVVRRGAADADVLVRDIRKHSSNLEAAREGMQALRRCLLDTGREQGAGGRAGSRQAGHHGAAAGPGAATAAEGYRSRPAPGHGNAGAASPLGCSPGTERGPEGKLHCRALQPSHAAHAGGRRRHGRGRW